MSAPTAAAARISASLASMNSDSLIPEFLMRENSGSSAASRPATASPFGCHFLAPLGNNTGGVRLHVAGDGDHLVGRRHFEIERQSNGVLEGVDIRIANMAPVLAKVRCDAVRAGRLGGECRTRPGRDGCHRAHCAPSRRDRCSRQGANRHRHWLVSLSEPSLSPTTASARLSFSGLRPARRKRAAARRLLRCGASHRPPSR